MLKVDINLVFTIINLLVLFVAMRIFFFKPIKKVIEDRQAEADRQFEEATEKPEQAEDLKNRYEASLAEAETEKKKIEQELKLYLGEAEIAENEHFRVSWKTVNSSRLDEKLLKAEMPETYEKYKKSVSSRRFTVKVA